MTTREFIEKSKPLIPWWKLYQKRLKENPTGWCPPVLLIRALRWELIFEKYLREVK